MKQIPCELCNQTGLIDLYEYDDEFGQEYFSADICPLCEGKGFLQINVLTNKK